jgi:phosphatidylglycerol:prolipoprotein diacylglycerol transferase
VEPEIHILGISLKSFGIVFACGFLAAGAILVRRLRELDLPGDYAYELAFSALVWYGGLLGGAICVIVWARWRDIFNVGLLDLACVPLALGYAIGRIGCQVSGDGDYGIRSKLPTSMSYPHGTVPTPPGVTVLPTPIYETVLMGCVAWWLWRMRDRFRPGALFAFYLVLSGSERLLIEFIRRNHKIFLGLTAPQLESIGLMIIGAVWLWRMHRGGGIEKANAPTKLKARPVPAPAR